MLLRFFLVNPIVYKFELIILLFLTLSCKLQQLIYSVARDITLLDLCKIFPNYNF